MSTTAEPSSKRRGGVLPLLAIAGLIALLWTWDPVRGAVAVNTAWKYGLDLLLVLPAVMVLTALSRIWVPESTVETLLGQSSGWKGLGLSLLFGSILEGPLYVAFPVARALLDKGARVRNVVAFISIWACGKIPQIVLEARFLGLPFSALRVSLSIAAAVAIGWSVEKASGKGSTPVSERPA